MLEPELFLQLERAPHREQSVLCVSMLNCFFGLSTYNTNNTVYRNNENVGLDVTGCHGNWSVSHFIYYG